MYDKYFNAEEQANSQDFLGMSGSFDVANFEGQNYLNAGGGEGMNYSQPYIISIENTTTDNITDATLLNSYSGTTTVTGASITYDISGVTYAQFLAQIENSPATIGLTRLSSTSASQVQQNFKITTGDANGSTASKIFVPNYDRYQQITTINDITYQYTINGFTSFIVSTLLASQKLTVLLYPSQKVNDTQELSGGTPVRTYVNPNINPFLNKG